MNALNTHWKGHFTSFCVLPLCRELLLNNNYLRNLPFELGRLFQLQVLVLKGNPLNTDMLGLYNEHNGVPRLLSYMLDNISRKFILFFTSHLVSSFFF